MHIRMAESGDERLLYVRDRQVGYIRGDTVGFTGFGSEDEAARAACMAHRTLARRRAGEGHWSVEEYLFGYTDDGQFVIAQSGVVARLLPPKLSEEDIGWGFEMTLRPEETAGAFALARARLMWNALRTGGSAAPA